MDEFRWGVVAPGNIARKFVSGLAALPDHRVVAVGSRSSERAQAFVAEAAPQATAYGSYAELFADPAIDAVYIASPHTAHCDQALAAIAAGKPVLCEKPMGVNGGEVERVTAAAAAAGVFCMEAMWTRFLPIMHIVRQWVATGRIGEPRMLQASFGFRCGWNPQHRLLNPALAGGSVLDVGIYPVAFAHDCFGAAPERVAALAHLGETGVDEQCGMLLQFAGGGLAVLDSAVRTQTEQVAKLYGTEGHIVIDPPFWRGTSARLVVGDQVDHEVGDHLVNGYEFEAQEVARCVRAGLTESPQMRHDDSRAIAATLDQVRAAIGLRYPADEALF